MIMDEDGSPITPSRILFDEEQNRLVGQVALDNGHMYPESYFYELKRIIGQDFYSSNVQDDLKRFTFSIKESDGIKVNVKCKDLWEKAMPIEEVYSEILKYMLNRAKKQMQKSITDAVITIPAYFDSNQRQSTIDTAHLAGFKSVRIINEPTAAALAFQYSNQVTFERVLLVYDFGGGTFDVSVVKTKGRHIKVLSTDGNCHLGGADIDRKLMDFIKNKIMTEHKIKVEDRYSNVRLKPVCKKAKESLSRSTKHIIELTKLPGLPDFEVALTRSQFNTIIENLINETMDITKQCLSNSNLDRTSVDKVVLVGGSSRIPIVKQKLTDLFGPDKIADYVNPDQIVAHGAAIYGFYLNSNKSEFAFEDILSLSLGTDTVGDEMSVLIKRNSEIPCTKRKIYKTTYDGQSDMIVKVYQGERKQASQNRLLGEFAVSNLTERPVGKVRVEIAFSINQEGVLRVEANEIGAENKKSLAIDIEKNGLSEKEIQRLIDQGENRSTEDEENLHYNKLMTKFLKLCTKFEKDYDDDEELLRQIDKLRHKVNNLDTTNPKEIETYIIQLQKSRK